jgi:hypothetical protein
MATDNKANEKNKGNTGNASNPVENDSILPDSNANQLINKKGEKYLREAGNIEDMPDAEEQWESEERIQGEKRTDDAQPQK